MEKGRTPETAMREAVALCLTWPGSYEDYPFGEDWAVVRHSGNKKMFAAVYQRGGKPCVNLKCEPMQADFYRGVYRSVKPGYHMNKVHWNTVELDGDVPMEELQAMIGESYALTR